MNKYENNFLIRCYIIKFLRWFFGSIFKVDSILGVFIDIDIVKYFLLFIYLILFEFF